MALYDNLLKTASDVLYKAASSSGWRWQCWFPGGRADSHTAAPYHRYQCRRQKERYDQGSRVSERYIDCAAACFKRPPIKDLKRSPKLPPSIQYWQFSVAGRSIAGCLKFDIIQTCIIAFHHHHRPNFTITG